MTALPIRWFDTHCHLQLGPDGDAARDRAFASGVEKMVCVGTDTETSLQALEAAKTAAQGVYVALGLHPHDAKNGLESLFPVMHDAFTNYNDLFVAIGECGLDYYYDHSPRDIQRLVFETQIFLAKQFNKTLVIHTRDAWDDTFEILRSAGAPPRTVIHCFTGGVEEARKALDLGFYLSFSGIVTFPKSVDLQEAARFCPLESLLIETDSPFLSPVPFRGKINEPANVSRIGHFISELKEVQVEELSARIFTNSMQVFGLQ